MELQKLDSQEMGFRKNLIAAIKNDGNLDLSVIDRIQISQELKKYKTERGGLNYPALFAIPSSERIHALSKQDFKLTVQLLAVSISLTLESINLKRPMTSGQIFDLAEIIIDDSLHDNISMEDVLLFLQKITRGEYGDMYESLDVPKFMNWFGRYRDERWDEAIRIKNEKELEFNTSGDQERTSQPNPLADHLTDFAGRIGDLKDKLKEKNDQIKFMRDKL